MKYFHMVFMGEKIHEKLLCYFHGYFMVEKCHEIPMTRVSWIISWVHLWSFNSIFKNW